MKGETAVPQARTILCAVYGLIALGALVATWGQNIAYMQNGIGDLLPAFGQFAADTKVNPAARSITADIGLFLLAAAIFMVIEARKHGVRFVWAYIVGGFLIAISVTFPLFMIARELRLAETDAKALRVFDIALLTALAAFVVGLVIWIEA
jgi:hypothetical protein